MSGSVAHAHRPGSALSKEDSGWEFKKGGEGRLGAPQLGLCEAHARPGRDKRY